MAGTLGMGARPVHARTDPGSSDGYPLGHGEGRPTRAARDATRGRGSATGSPKGSQGGAWAPDAGERRPRIRCAGIAPWVYGRERQGGGDGAAARAQLVRGQGGSVRRGGE